MTDTGKLAESYIRSLEARDWDTVIALQSPDVVYDFAPSREGIDGCDDLLRFDQEHLGDWQLAVNRIVADDGQAVIWLNARVGDVHQTANIRLDFGDDGKIIRVTDFWPETYEPPPGREQPVERH